jgi:cytochrome oxidase Cu insertion factor (SCO1/SenC/PrrC family)
MALGVLLLATVTWWALALWPAPTEGAAWLLRAREVCFGRTATGLPEASGWLLLLLQPPLMLGAIFVIWGRDVPAAVSALAARPMGRAALAAVSVVLLAGTFGASVRVARAMEPADAFAVTDAPVPDTYPRLDRAPPPLALLDQHGNTVTTTQYLGRPVIVTFAFGHCETVCPVVVHDVLEARRLSEVDAVVLVLSLDPWRDTPARLPSIATQWHLSPDDHALSGPVDQVEAVLDDWNVARSRNLQTGDIVHPRLVYLIDEAGTMAYAATGGIAMLQELLRRL